MVGTRDADAAAPPVTGTRIGVIDEGADFAGWYRATWPRVVRAVAVFTGDRDGAADIAADAFTRALERWDSPARPADPTAWVVVVAINLAKRRWRRASRVLPGGEGVGSVELGAADVDVWDAVRRLSTRNREAIALRYAFDLTERQVAEAMGITPGATAAMLHAARRQLRALLEETEDG
jgi:RNA polymerase sigma-70 factor (ECF subfamily)